ncbi:MAG: kelch repeat-containing protein, partial [Bacteroidota bacterium]|nr:kelch repeat-containing protein [Bacteroidota bacterium]
MKHHTIVTILGFLGLTIIAQVSTSQQTWRTVAPMNTPRFYFSMVPLQNGTVLAIGGEDVNDNPIGSCELYDPASGIWTYTGSLAVPRGRGCAVVLSSGKVAVFGGQVSASVAQTDQIEVYDPATKTWSSGGHLLLARQNETATYVNDSSIVIIGGLSADGTTASCEVYNSLTMSSRAIASMHQNRHDHMSLLLSNSNNILVAGGRDGGSGSRYFSECEMYDQENDVWTVMTPMQQARIMGVLAQFPDGSILAAGGRNTPSTSAPGSELLDTASLQWTTISPMLQPCTVSGNVMLPDARYLMTGGQIGGVWSIETDNITTPTCEWYDRPNQRWYYAPTLNLSRDKHVAVFLHQGVNNSLPSDMVMAAGGLVGIPIVDSFQH